MWLLDANMDVHLASVLTGLGIDCDTAGNRGWKANLLPARSNYFRSWLSSW